VIWPPLAFVGIGRYDDPTQRISTLYASVQRRTAFLETLDGYRPNLSLLAQLDEDPAQLGWLPSVKTPDAPVLGVIPDPYFDRLIAEFKVEPGQRWLDLRAPETTEALRKPLAQQILKAGHSGRFVHGDLLGTNHQVTQVFATWAIEHDFAGIAYASCHDPDETCWVLFDHAHVAQVESIEPISREDPDLLAVAQRWHLSIPVEK
jgi:hypothetical protein